MIDWKQEIAIENYCGYCDGTISGKICDGACLNNPEHHANINDNRIKHVKVKYQQMKLILEETNRKLEDYREVMLIHELEELRNNRNKKA